MLTRDFDPATDVTPALALFDQLGYPLDEAALRARIAASDPAVRVLVADDGEGVVGVLVLHLLAPWHAATNWALISALVVDDAVRSQGAGAALLAAAQQHARAAGCSHVELSSSQARTRAHAFYERHGFVEVRKRLVKRLAA